ASRVVAQRKPRSSRLAVAGRRCERDGEARCTADLNDPPRVCHLPIASTVAHHSQTLPHRSTAPYGLASASYRVTAVVVLIRDSWTLHRSAENSSPQGNTSPRLPRAAFSHCCPVGSALPAHRA